MAPQKDSAPDALTIDLDIVDDAARTRDFFERLQAAALRTRNDWTHLAFGHVAFQSAQRLSRSSGVAFFSLLVDRSLTNPTGMLHGGAAATTCDTLSSMAVATVARAAGWATSGVSRTLSCTYLRPLPEGTRAVVEARVVHIGRFLIETSAVIRNEAGDVCVTCQHGKAAVLGRPRVSRL